MTRPFRQFWKKKKKKKKGRRKKKRKMFGKYEREVWRRKFVSYDSPTRLSATYEEASCSCNTSWKHHAHRDCGDHSHLSARRCNQHAFRFTSAASHAISCNTSATFDAMLYRSTISASSFELYFYHAPCTISLPLKRVLVAFEGDVFGNGWRITKNSIFLAF